MRHFIKYDLVPLLSMVAVCVFPCVVMYSRNADEAPASTMLPFMAAFLINALVFFLIGLLFFRNASRSAFFTDAAMLVVINFCLVSRQIKELLPFWHDRYLLILAGILLLALFILFMRKKPDLRAGCILVLVGFGAVTVMNLIMAVPAILGSREARRGPGPEAGSPPPQFLSEERPNVYFFLFDEYGGYENLLTYYDYDNTPFLTELESRSFNVSRTSHNTEAVATDTIVPNLLNLDYVVRVEESGHKKAVLRDNTFLYRMFHENGYDVNIINHVDYLGTSGMKVLTKNQTRRTISEYLMRNSIYNKSELLRWLMEYYFTMDYGAHYLEGFRNAMDAGLNCWQEAQEHPTLTIGYYQFPHSPTMVGRNGEELDYTHGWDWANKDLYLGQVEYCNKFILELVDTITANDPNALIFLMSDHGNRYAIHMMQIGAWTEYDPHVENPLMQNILNCVYYQGRSFPIEGETGINTLRLVFSEVFGMDMPPIEPYQDYSSDYDDEQE